MYIYIYIHIHTYIYIYVYLYIYRYMYYTLIWFTTIALAHWWNRFTEFWAAIVTTKHGFGPNAENGLQISTNGGWSTQTLQVGVSWKRSLQWKMAAKRLHPDKKGIAGQTSNRPAQREPQIAVVGVVIPIDHPLGILIYIRIRQIYQ